MEVEEMPSYGDTDMIADDSWYEDHHDMVPESAGFADPLEVDMEADPEMIEYEMEDAPTEDVIVESAPVPSFPAPENTAFNPASIRPKTPPHPVSAPEVVFESPSHGTPDEHTEKIIEARVPDVVEPALEPAAPSQTTPVESYTPTSPAHQPQEPSALLENAPQETVATAPQSAPVHAVSPEVAQAQVVDPAPLPTTEEVEVVTVATEAEAEAQAPLLEHAAPEASPVLISSSWDSSPFYLFSYPAASSSSELPPLYFADRPELFFEPISNVFEALRELWGSESVFSHSELVLASEALELTLPEVSCPLFQAEISSLTLCSLG